MIQFHGGCAGCTQQESKGTDFCVGCQFFDGNWDLPNLSNRPPNKAEIERERLKKKFGMVDNRHTTRECGNG
jgi:hypothetical protein